MSHLTAADIINRTLRITDERTGVQYTAKVADFRCVFGRPEIRLYIDSTPNQIGRWFAPAPKELQSHV